MRRPALFLIGLFTSFIVPQLGQAQDWSFAIGPGVTQYLGDVNEQQLGGNRWALNAEAWYRLTDNIQIKSGISFYQLQAQDADTTRLRSFQANNFEFYSTGMYSFKQGYFTPFLYLGIGATTSTPRGDTQLGYYNLRDVEPEAERVPGLVGIIPFGAGLEYEITPVLSVVFDLALRYALTDQLDAMSKEIIVVDALSPLAREYYTALSDERARVINEEETIRGGDSMNEDVYGMFSVKIKFTPTNSIFGCIDPYKYSRPNYKRKRRNFDPI
uniref:Outer membrane protein beta-barrel domain-containing protein n=1 Tax=Roseihalotalea indica TaxID=2867963 RepID=A0AA49GKI7_9BACT|nr:hypothetical protein K4G66_17775 [Tunicatimonas sp. TK19036]